MGSSEASQEVTKFTRIQSEAKTRKNSAQLKLSELKLKRSSFLDQIGGKVLLKRDGDDNSKRILRNEANAFNTEY